MLAKKIMRKADYWPRMEGVPRPLSRSARNFSLAPFSRTFVISSFVDGPLALLDVGIWHPWTVRRLCWNMYQTSLNSDSNRVLHQMGGSRTKHQDHHQDRCEIHHSKSLFIGEAYQRSLSQTTAALQFRWNLGPVQKIRERTPKFSPLLSSV